MTPAAAFRAHCVHCAICRADPATPCAVGARLLGRALVAAPITRYACPNHCETTGQPAPEKCKHGKAKL